MKCRIGLLLALALTACQVETQWLEAVEEPALTFKERQFDPRATRLRERMAQWPLTDRDGTDMPTAVPDQRRLFQVANPTWQGIPLTHAARPILADRTARGDYALFHIPATHTRVMANLHEQLARENWHLLERIASGDGHGPHWEYLAFWRSQLSFLPQQLFTTACALVRAEQAGLTALELSTRCAELRHTALAQAQTMPAGTSAEIRHVVDLGALVTHVPSAWSFAGSQTPGSPCAAPETFACLYQHNLEYNGDTLTLRLLAGDRDTVPTILHPHHVLDIAQALAEGSLPLLIQPVTLRHGERGIQLYSWMAHDPAPDHVVVRSEIHFFQERRYLVFEGTLDGATSQVPMLSRILQQIEYGTVE